MNSPLEGDTEASEAEIDFRRALSVLQKWCGDNSPANLSAAQMGIHLLLQIHHSHSELGNFLAGEMLVPLEKRQEGSRARDVLPLLQIEDARKAAGQVVEQGKFKGVSRLKGSKAAKEMRRVGLLVWHFLVVGALNFLWGGCSGSGPHGSGLRTARGEEASQRIWKAVKAFCDEKGSKTGGVPRTPSLDWRAELSKMKLSYQGEVVEKARPLTLAQILDGLPPVEFGAKINLLDVVSPEMKEQLLNPEALLLEGDELPPEVPEPRIHAEKDEWHKICRALYERGLVRPVKDFPVLDGQRVVNGAFGVAKSGKVTAEGQEVLRFIFDLRASNSVLRVIEGDIKSLTGAAAFQRIVLEDSEVIRLSGDDLVSAFYLFELPPVWSPFLALRGAVPWRALGIDEPGETHLGAAVLPMGWNSAVGIMQHVHRRLALEGPPRGGGLPSLLEIRKDAPFPARYDGWHPWSIYLDDTTVFEVLERQVAESLVGEPAEAQERLRRAYEFWGIPRSDAKALNGVARAERLGALIDGEEGVLRGSTERALYNLCLGSWLLSQRWVDRKALQIFAGKEVHTLQFRRPLFSVMDVIWKQIAKGGEQVVLSADTIQEILLSGSLQPMRFTDLRAQLDPCVTASDASEQGGGAVYSKGLSRSGIEEAQELMRGKDEAGVDGRPAVVVVDWFGGIGGLPVSVERAGLRIGHLIVVEKDRDCRRLHRRVWPFGDEKVDITKVSKKELRTMLKRVPGLTGVVSGGGSPCQGLSRLSSERKHLGDPRSALFFQLVEKMKWIEELAAEMHMWCLSFVENVVADDEDVAAMTEALGWTPILACSRHLSWVRRPRLYWCPVKLRPRVGVSFRSSGSLVEVVMESETEPLELVLDKGWHWPWGEKDGSARWPTFTRTIPRHRPPPQPAGLSQCSETDTQRWAADGYRYPPYTYQEKFLVKNTDGVLRPLNANERERLMGFEPGHTRAMSKKDPTSAEEKEACEVMRCAAVGNAFHCGVVAALVNGWCAEMGVLEAISPREIQQAFYEVLKTDERTVEEEDDSEASHLDTAERVMESDVEEERAALRGKASLVLPVEQTSMDRDLPAYLVEQFLRRVEFRGSDVRLDVGTIYRPDCFPRAAIDVSRWKWAVSQAYSWVHKEHINILELRAYLQAVRWRCRRPGGHSVRFLHLLDSQVVLAVATKGRSSSRRLNNVLRKLSALLVANNLHPLLAWVESELNPADAPSRLNA